MKLQAQNLHTIWCVKKKSINKFYSLPEKSEDQPEDQPEDQSNPVKNELKNESEGESNSSGEGSEDSNSQGSNSNSNSENENDSEDSRMNKTKVLKKMVKTEANQIKPPMKKVVPRVPVGERFLKKIPYGPKFSTQDNIMIKFKERTISSITKLLKMNKFVKAPSKLVKKRAAEIQTIMSTK